MAPSPVPDHSIRICADRGGTFTDVHASWPDSASPNGRKEVVVKLLSVDKANYADAPTEGCRRVLELATGQRIPRGTRLDTSKIDTIRLSTTVATNALLERKGEKHALVITKGFKDLLEIGNQTRPKIFDLHIKKPSTLYSDVIEVDERVTLVGFSSDAHAQKHAIQFDSDGHIARPYTGPGRDENGIAEGPGDVVQGLSGEAVRILRRPDAAAVRKRLQALFNKGYRSLAIVFVHSYTFPEHELLVGEIARDIGFTQISMSSQLLPMIKMVPRGTSATADAYLSPVLMSYLDGFFDGFDARLRQGGNARPHVEFMGSDGGLLSLDNFSGLKSILSGPAGGVVGYALTSWDEKRRCPIIGLDVGGTSTDVSRFAGRYELVYETTTAGVSIQSPQLDINTVAAGGGSCLTFSEGLFRAGPESAGAHPGPVCYRKGGPLAVTDANLVLGRLVLDTFPSIFGPSEKEPLDADASFAAFQKLTKRINAETGTSLSVDEVVYGFVDVANESMARPIRTLTDARGHASADHILASFGGAGGQHACEIAKLLGITRVLIHRYSSILSAYGLALADRAYELQEPSSALWSTETAPSLHARVDKLAQQVQSELVAQGFDPSHVHLERYLNMRFDGSDTALMALCPADGDYAAAFEQAYLAEFGFLLEDKAIIVDDVKVKGIGKTHGSLGESVFDEMDRLTRSSLDPTTRAASHQSVYFKGEGRVRTPVFRLPELKAGEVIVGPALLVDETATIVLVPGSETTITSSHVFIELA